MEYCKGCKYVTKDELVCTNCVKGNRFKKGEPMNEISFEMLKEKGCPSDLLLWWLSNQKTTVYHFIETMLQNYEVLKDCGIDYVGWISWLKENFEPKVTHKIGNRYKGGNAEYLLCATGISKVTLVDIKDGRYWHINTEVRNPFELTEYEFKTVCDGSEFKLIPKGGEK